MDNCLSYSKSSVFRSFPFTVKRFCSSSAHSHGSYRSGLITSVAGSTFSGCSHAFRPIRLGVVNRRRVVVVASAEASSSPCEYGGSLNTPLVPKSTAGRFLCGVLQNDRESFHDAVAKQLVQLVADRDETDTRMRITSDSDEACIHRRIAELKEKECQAAVEDVLYMLVFYKFSEIGVYLVPRFSDSVYNGRFEVWPSHDWELESIHSAEVFGIIKEHLSTVVGWKENSTLMENWKLNKISRLHLCEMYVASILYGYFVKSVSLRHHLESTLALANGDHNISTSSHNTPLSESSSGVSNVALGQVSRKKQDNLRSYVMSFNPETVKMCAKPKSMEVWNLIDKHCNALFKDKKTGMVKAEDVIVTSRISLKRLAMEAIAFGSFVWDAEEYVNTVYKLQPSRDLIS